jgi:hypothetical protein
LKKCGIANLSALRNDAYRSSILYFKGEGGYKIEAAADKFVYAAHIDKNNHLISIAFLGV